ncbi:hypothetical protein AAMO2058_001472000 [Amorphochlora amoebiformis]
MYSFWMDAHDACGRVGAHCGVTGQLKSSPLRRLSVGGNSTRLSVGVTRPDSADKVIFASYFITNSTKPVSV